MFSLKKIGVSFAVGFTISLIAGIIGNVGFGDLLLRAILSGLFFALLVGGAMILYQKFLSSDDLAFDTLQQEHTVVQTGSNVDITLDDTDLPDSASAPSFSLVAGRSSDSATVPENGALDNSVSDKEANDSFKVGQLNTVAASGLSQASARTDDSSPETVSETVPVKKTVPRDDKYRNVADLELDMLPDIENIVGIDKSSVLSDDDEEVIQDTAFAETGETMPIVPAGFSDMGDARTIVAALRTAMAKDT